MITKTLAPARALAPAHRRALAWLRWRPRSVEPDDGGPSFWVAVAALLALALYRAGS